MCLLKRSDHDTNCGHEECESFYMINKQMCMHSLNQQNQPSNTTNISLSTLQPQIQLSSTIPAKVGSFVIQQNTLNAKRSANNSLENELEVFLVNKRLIKAEKETKSENKANIPDKNNNKNTLTEFNFISQQAISQNNADKSSHQSPFGNGTAQVINGQFPFAKSDGANLQLGNSTIFIPFVQGSQTNGNSAISPLALNPQNGFTVVNGSQLFSQNTKTKLTNGNNIVNVNSINLNTSEIGNQNISINNLNANPFINQTINNIPNWNNSNNVQIEAWMEEFQLRISELLLSQNKMLIELKEKNEIIQDTLACLINEMSVLKTAIKQGVQEKVNAVNNPLLTNIASSNSNESATTESLLTFLYGPNYDFQYNLVLKSGLSLPLYRERNFKFTLFLTDKNGTIVQNLKKIALTIAIYSSESVPKYIDSNTSGNKILKGFIDKDLLNGSVTFDKIQIKEVTSHFRNGWVFFIVYPKISSHMVRDISGTSKEISPQKIRPFILEKLIVKAKKSKEKEMSVEADDENESSEEAVSQEVNHQTQQINEDSQQK